MGTKDSSKTQKKDLAGLYYVPISVPRRPKTEVRTATKPTGRHSATSRRSV
jgi:hypothetical protein